MKQLINKQTNKCRNVELKKWIEEINKWKKVELRNWRNEDMKKWRKDEMNKWTNEEFEETNNWKNVKLMDEENEVKCLKTSFWQHLGCRFC